MLRDRVQKFKLKATKNERFAGMDAEEFYFEKLNNGLSTLERVALIIAEVCIHGPKECLSRTLKLFQMKFKNPLLSDNLEPVGILKNYYFCIFKI